MKIMAYKADISNVAYTQEYKDYRNNIISKAYHKQYKRDEEIVKNGNLKIIVENYSTVENYLREKNWYCGHTKVYDNKDNFICEYFNLYVGRHFFPRYIEHSNGLSYLVYKEDLYGYSVFEIETKNVFDYYPKDSFNGKAETFIATDIHYNKNNDVFAVDGCYWSCPCDTFLVKINNPMEEFGEFVNLHYIIDPEYDDYDDIRFVEWENNNVKLELDFKEIITLTEETYKNEMMKSKQE
jgi:hypothetical protein